MSKEIELSTAAYSLNSKQPTPYQGMIDITENQARIVLPVGVPVCVHTMMEIAQTCLLYGCTSYVQQLGTQDCLSIVFYYEK
jgi:hypothetical protein